MKKELVYSIALHLLLLLLAIIIIRTSKPEKKPAPFVATIITPEEMQRQEARPRAAQPRRQEIPSRMPQLPSNLPPPKELSAVPSSKAPARKARAAPPAANTATANAGRSQARGSSEPDIKPGPNGTVPEQQTARGNSGKDSSQSGRQFPSARSMREKLFDREILAKLTPRETEGPSDDSVTFDTKEYRYWGYMQRLKEKIQAAWKYPSEAQQRRLNGELYIKFTINKDGRLASAELVHTSGYKVLDDAALRALREADPYWPLPDAWKEDSLTITGRFIYYFQNTYIR